VEALKRVRASGRRNGRLVSDEELSTGFRQKGGNALRDDPRWASIPVVIFFMIILHKGPNTHVVLVPVAMLLQWIALVGIALILAPVTVMMTDVERLVRIAVRMLFYLCPVLYSKSAILDNARLPGFIKQFYEYNPFTTILSLYRGGVYRAELPTVDIAFKGTMVSVALLVIGVWVFRRMEPAVLKEI